MRINNEYHLAQLSVTLHRPSSWQRVGLEFEECCQIPVSWRPQVVWAVAPGHHLGSWCYSFSCAFISAYSRLKLERLSEIPKCLFFFVSFRQRLPPKNVYYYRCPDHRKNYVMSFAFCFDREEDVYQFAYCYPYTYTRFQHYLDSLQKRNMDYFFREQLGQSMVRPIQRQAAVGRACCGFSWNANNGYWCSVDAVLWNF